MGGFRGLTQQVLGALRQEQVKEAGFEDKVRRELERPTLLSSAQTKIHQKLEQEKRELAEQPTLGRYTARKVYRGLPPAVQGTLPSVLREKLSSEQVHGAFRKTVEKIARCSDKEKTSWGSTTGFPHSAYGGNQAQNPPGMRARSAIPGFSAPPLEVKQAQHSGFATSQYSGPLSYGRFKMTSGLPPFRSPAMTKHDPKAGDPDAWMVGANKTAAPLTPAGRLAATAAVGKPKVSAPPGPSIADIAKPKGFGMKLPGATKTAEEKRALLERLIRLGATDVPGTPRMIMRRRSPQELRSLQDGVESWWNQRVTSPILRKAEPLLAKVPRRVQGKARAFAGELAKDPVGIAAVGAAVPVPGADALYIGAKRGAEKLIDRLAPLPP